MGKSVIKEVRLVVSIFVGPSKRARATVSHLRIQNGGSQIDMTNAFPQCMFKVIDSINKFNISYMLISSTK